MRTNVPPVSVARAGINPLANRAVRLIDCAGLQQCFWRFECTLTIAALIVAAGRGTRAATAGSAAEAVCALAGQMMLTRTLGLHFARIHAFDCVLAVIARETSRSFTTAVRPARARQTAGARARRRGAAAIRPERACGALEGERPGHRPDPRRGAPADAPGGHLTRDRRRDALMAQASRRCRLRTRSSAARMT